VYFNSFEFKFLTAEWIYLCLMSCACTYYVFVIMGCSAFNSSRIDHHLLCCSAGNTVCAHIVFNL